MFRINVLRIDNKPKKKYRHYFETTKKSIKSEKRLIEMVKEFTILFPFPEYIITASKSKKFSENIDLCSLIDSSLSIYELKSKLKFVNFKKLSISEMSNKDVLRKMIVWEEEYTHVAWEDFKDHYFKCDTCGSYDDQQCICYSR
jgi:hypothetical protein